MSIEERIERLEQLNQELNQKITLLETIQNDRFVSAKELAEIMKCSVNNIYIKIRKGDIYATDKLGTIPRIPMSQFYEKQIKQPMSKKKPTKAKLSMKDQVFG